MARGLKSARRGDLEVYGKSQKDAGDKLSAAIDFALTGDYDPYVRRYNGSTLIVTRTLEGWLYGLLPPDGADMPLAALRQGSTYPSRKTAIEMGLSHLYQNVIDLLDLFADDQIPDDLKHVELRKDLVRNGAFQRAYFFRKREAIPGENDDHWHHFACHHDTDKRFTDRESWDEALTVLYAANAAKV